jgi:hypothetical protein
VLESPLDLLEIDVRYDDKFGAYFDKSEEKDVLGRSLK